VRGLLAQVQVLHADETCGRAAGGLSYVHVACTEYLTLMHVGGRGRDDIDAGGVLTEFTGVLDGLGQVFVARIAVADQPSSTPTTLPARPAPRASTVSTPLR
jgi:transposase